MDDITDRERLQNGIALHYRLQQHRLHRDLEWLLPPGLLDGVDEFWGVPVRHVEGLESPYLAHRIKLAEQPWTS